MRRSHVNVDWCSAVRNQPLFRSTKRSEEHQNEYPNPLVECHAPARTVVKLPEDFVLHSLRRTFRTPLVLSNARVAKSADAKDLKSFSPQGECGFKSRPGHQSRSSRSTNPLPVCRTCFVDRGFRAIHRPPDTAPFPAGKCFSYHLIERSMLSTRCFGSRRPWPSRG